MERITYYQHMQHMGCNNWEGLQREDGLVLDRDFKNLILRCGNFSRAAYDNYDGHFHSLGSTEPLNGVRDLFRNIDVLHRYSQYYEAVAYLTTAPGLTGVTDWIGYVATTTDQTTESLGRREVYIVWRGTIKIGEWMKNILGVKRDYSGDKTNAKVHSGWLSMYNRGDEESLKKQVERALKRFKFDPYPLSVVVTGHSLGGALATITAVDIKENDSVWPETLVCGVIFGCPQVGNLKYKERFRELQNNHNLKILHIRNSADFVTWLPDHLFDFYVPIQTCRIIPKPFSVLDLINIFKMHQLKEILDLLAQSQEF